MSNLGRYFNYVSNYKGSSEQADETMNYLRIEFWPVKQLRLIIDKSEKVTYF